MPTITAKQLAKMTGIKQSTAYWRLRQFRLGKISEKQLFAPVNTNLLREWEGLEVGPRKKIEDIKIGSWEKQHLLNGKK